MAEVWEEIRTDRERGARQLVAEYGNRLYAAALLLCPNAADAEELVFRTFERAVERIRQYAPSGAFFGWLYAILLNFRRMDLRKRRPDVRPVGTTFDLPEVADESLANALAAMDAANLRAVIRRSPPADAEVLTLRFFEGMNLEEIAALLDIPVGTVKSRLHHAKATLRDLLAEFKEANDCGGAR